MTFRGTIKRISKDTGVGTIIREDGEKIRLHFSHMVGPTFKNLGPGDVVEFEVEEGRRGLEGRKVTLVVEP